MIERSCLVRNEPAVSLPKKFWLGFDLGGTKMLSVLFDDQFQVVIRKRKKTKGMEGVAAGQDRIADLIQETLAEANITEDQLAGIGIGCPGPIDMEKGVVCIAPNLGWKRVAISEFLEKRFSCPVRVLNDVDAGIYGEYRFGAAMNAFCVVGVFPGTGIGGGCVHDGRILRGMKLSAMEIGHMKIASTSRSSGVDMPGTLEYEASRLSIAAECVKLAYRGEAPELLKLGGTDISNVRSKTIAQAIKNGEKSVERVVRLAAQQVGYGVANIVHLLSPDIIILGGGLVEAVPELYVEEVWRIAKKSVMECYVDTFEIRVAALGDDAGAMGAAAWAAKSIPQDADLDSVVI